MVWSELRLLVEEEQLIHTGRFGGIAGVAHRVGQNAASRKAQRVLLAECSLVVEKQLLSRWDRHGCDLGPHVLTDIRDQLERMGDPGVEEEQSNLN
jgi:hypothetical protein